MMDFGKLGQLKNLMQNSQAIRAELEQKLAGTIVEGAAGGGLVTVKMNGKKELLKLTIDPANVSGSLSPSDVEMLEDLITAAVNDAGRKADAAIQSMMKDTLQSNMGGLLDGLKLPDGL